MSFPDSLFDGSVGFLGLGVSNIGAIRYISKNFPRAKLVLRSDTAPRADYLMELPSLTVLCGKGAREGVLERVLFLSPTARRDAPELAAAVSRGTLLTSDVEYFFDKYEDDYVTVSGTNGKSTLTYLISELVSKGARRAVPCGNFGRCPLDLIGTDALPVMELSSFQLTYSTPRAKIACLTSVLEDHLDWHRDIEEYRTAKTRVLQGAELAVVDSDLVDGELIPGTPFATVSLRGGIGVRGALRIGYDGGFITVNSARYADIRGAVRLEDYNIRNYLHLTAVSLAMGISEEVLVDTVRSFRGIAHRCELIAEHRGIRFINSSIDTSPSRTLTTLSQLDGEISLILGGRDKGLSKGALCDCIKKRGIPCVLMGECRQEYANELRGVGFTFADCMSDAVKIAVGYLSRGGTVLLSPAAQSFDGYTSFEARGNDFASCVRELIKSSADN